MAAGFATDKVVVENNSLSGDQARAAAKQAHIGGADIIAQKDINLTGDSVVIDPGHDKRTRDEKYEQKSSGLTVALSGTAGSAVNSAVTTAKSAKQSSDSRLAILQGTQAALSGVQANQALELDQAKGASDKANNNTFGVSASLGSQSSKSSSHMESETTAGSSLNAGSNVIINATGSDITVAGSQIKAGKDVTLDAARDVNLIASQNSQQTTGNNSSSGGSLGVGVGTGSGGSGISISANAHNSKGHEKGNGVWQNETTVDAGNRVTLISGRDATLAGAQVSGERVTADIGRDLMIVSQQDSDHYDSKQSSVSGGAGYTFGAGGFSGSINASRDKMTSDYDSVQEQSGIFAGKGGFDITVGNHTQLDGGVIASTAGADKNSLDTGTLGFSDIHNQADFKTEHQGAGLSSGGSIGGQFAGNMANGLLAGGGNSGHAEGSTQAAVSEGTITVRDQANQQQDVADLSRDAAHANGSISPIFDKEKEQRRLQEVQLIGAIGSQAADIARTQGEINGLNAARAKLAKDGKHEPGPDASEVAKTEYQKALRETSEYKTAMDKYGTGSSIQRGIQAATAALQGLAGGNIAGALAGAAAPELAYRIGHGSGSDLSDEAKVVAHAILGGAVAALQGNSVAAGAAGAAAGELAANAIMSAMYPGKKASELSEEQKQTVSALATISAGMAGGLAGDSTGSAVAGGQAGKNAVENNFLSVSEKTELELAKLKLNSKDPAEREKAQQTVNELREKDIASDQKVIDACGNGNAGSAACAGARLEVIAAKGEYESTGNYNSKASQQYADSYGQIVNLLNITSVDAENQQQVKDAMVNYTMTQLGMDKTTAEAYVETYDGMKIVAASVAPILGGAVASKIESLVSKSISGSGVKASSTTIKSYGPIEHGPLGDPNDLESKASTFRSGSYSQKVAETDIYIYRDYGGTARPDGRFWTPEPSKGPLQSQMDSAVLPEWGNTFENQAIMKIPKGTVYYEGAAASQTGTVGTNPSLLGGGTQIYLPDLDPTWIIKK